MGRPKGSKNKRGHKAGRSKGRKIESISVSLNIEDVAFLRHIGKKEGLSYNRVAACWLSLTIKQLREAR